MEVKTNYETLEVELSEGVTRVKINRPKALNALNAQVLSELLELLEFTVYPSASRALVISGGGDKAFVVGADIAAMGEMSVEESLHFARLGQELTKALEAAPFVNIAEVQGYALGGGCELAMACDIVVASTKALFGQPEVDLGLIPGFGGTQRLVKRVGVSTAMDMLLAGRKLNGKEACEAGLVSRVVEPEALEDEVNSVVAGVLKASPSAVAETKRLALDAMEMPLNQGLASEASSFANCFAGSESKEGIAAFLEKRKASFSL